jgi:hypothetical protein
VSQCIGSNSQAAGSQTTIVTPVLAVSVRLSVSVVLSLSSRKEALAASEHEWVDHEPVFVYQVVRQQRVHKRATAVDEDVLAAPLL